MDFKEIVFELAKAGKPRPKQDTEIGVYLRNALSPSQIKTYDEKFYKELKTIAPAWFRRKYQSNEHKQTLLDLAASMQSRPNYKEPLGVALNNYITEKRMSYDEVFTKTIVELRPDWFYSPKIKKMS